MYHEWLIVGVDTTYWVLSKNEKIRGLNFKRNLEEKRKLEVFDHL